MTEVQSVPEFNLERYLGQWFEIGRLPLKFEDDDASDITATYSLNDDGTVKVDNRCLDEDGEPTQALGQGTVDDSGPGRLKVTFLPEGLRWIPFTQADYWVLKIDDDYTVALVGTPDHKFLWLLARDHEISDATKQEYLDEAERQGFDLSEWITPAQSGRVWRPVSGE